MICSRCSKEAGNNSQGHYWALCKAKLRAGIPWHEAVGKFHFCCPDDCELEND